MRYLAFIYLVSIPFKPSFQTLNSVSQTQKNWIIDSVSESTLEVPVSADIKQKQKDKRVSKVRRIQSGWKFPPWSQFQQTIIFFWQWTLKSSAIFEKNTGFYFLWNSLAFKCCRRQYGWWNLYLDVRRRKWGKAQFCKSVAQS